MDQVLHAKARESLLAMAYVDFRSAQHEHQVTASGVFVTELRDLPWAHFVVARAQGLEAAWEAVQDDYLAMVEDRAEASVAAQQTISTARTARTTAVANAQFTFDTSLAGANETRAKAIANHLATFRTDEVTATSVYQVAAATATRNYIADMSHADYWRDIEGNTTVVSDHEAAALTARQTAEKAARYDLALAQAAHNGVHDRSDAESRLAFATTVGLSHLALISSRASADVTFIETQHGSLYEAAIDRALLAYDYEQLEATERHEQLNSLSVDFNPPVDISSWAILASDLSAAVLADSLGQSQLEYENAIDNAMAVRDKALSNAVAASLFDGLRALSAQSHDLGLAAADWALEVSRELADNALAQLGLYTPRFPAIPNVQQLDALPRSTAPNHAHAFQPNDSTREPYTALINGQYDLQHSLPILALILSQQQPLFISSDRLTEAVIHDTQPVQDNPIDVYLRERSLSNTNNAYISYIASILSEQVLSGSSSGDDANISFYSPSNAAAANSLQKIDVVSNIPSNAPHSPQVLTFPLPDNLSTTTSDIVEYEKDSTSGEFSFTVTPHVAGVNDWTTSKVGPASPKPGETIWVQVSTQREYPVGRLSADGEWVELTSGGRTTLVALRRALDNKVVAIEQVRGDKKLSWIHNRIDGIRSPHRIDASSKSVGIFIDGTSNHLDSVTNVLKLYNSYQGNKFYYGGVGNYYDFDDLNTLDGFVDPIFETNLGDISARGLGGAVGLGWTAIINKARADIKRIKAMHQNQDISIDIFGFSRGAAMANRLAFQLSAEGVTVRFLGMFDPVYSVGGPGPDSDYVLTPKNFAAVNTVQSAIHLHVDHVVSLVAQHERRVSFPATNHFRVTIEKRWQSLLQLRVPGTHGDVGGHWMSNLQTQQITMSIMALEAIKRGVPFEFRGIETDLLKYKKSTYAPPGVLLQLQDRYDRFWESWDSAVWNILSEQQIVELINNATLDAWKPGPFGIQKEQGYNLMGRAYDELEWQLTWWQFLKIRHTQPSMNHVTRQLDWTRTLHRHYPSVNKDMLKVLDMVVPNELGEGGWEGHSNE